MFQGFCAIFVLFLVAAGASACNNSVEIITHSLDRTTFRWWGGTMFSEPTQVSLVAVNLDEGRMTGHEVIVNGKVAEVGKFGTYVIVNDDKARLLVNLSRLNSSQGELNFGEGKEIIILGTIERGKKGLPFLLAQAWHMAPAKPIKGSI